MIINPNWLVGCDHL